ncbi:hypothetical protein [Neobacillus drentensis]|uniref:hypothetical protein n=1 Tax=Neobacillus drentensis TaxID=220684 RepID=UPI002FFE8F7E
MSSIIVNGSPIQDFTPEQTDYYFTLDSNDREVPSVTAVTEDPNATAAIWLPAAVPGIVYITAKAKIVLGETIQEYKIKKAEP